jgi:hypothetical protein
LISKGTGFYKAEIEVKVKVEVEVEKGRLLPSF